MQALAPPAGANNPNAHAAAEVRTALLARTGSRRLTFHYRLLDSANRFLVNLDNVLDGTVNQDWLAPIKRTASFRVRDTGVINFLSDRIQPVARQHLPPYGPADWVQWPQGVFLLSTPSRSANEAGQVVRDVDAYDTLQVYTDDLVTARYTVTAGALYTTAVSTLLGNVPKSITTSTKALPTAKEWEPGTAKLTIINELLAAINYDSLAFDENGVAVVKPYATPATRAEEWRYADDQDSVIIPEVEQTLDLFAVPNKWTLVVSDPDRVALSATYTNQDPGSPTSTIRRGRTIVDFRSDQDAADQATLTALAAKLAFEASQVFEAIEFPTAVMPIHGGNDVYRLRYGPLAVDAKYSEQSWSMPLKAGAQMRHRARRVVTV